MKRYLLTLSASALLAGQAGAFELTGGEASVTFYDYSTVFSGQPLTIEGSAVVSFGRISTQADYAVWRYEVDEALTEYSAFTLHLGYELNDNLTLGAYAGKTIWQPDLMEDYAGLQVLYSTGPFEVEAYAGTVEWGSSRKPTQFGARGTYTLAGLGPIDSFDLSAGYFRNSVDFATWTFVDLAVQANFGNGAFAEFSTISGDIDGVNVGSGPVLSLRVGYEFGGGEIWDGRSYTEKWHNY